MIFQRISIHHTEKAKGHPNHLECPFFWYIFGLINWSNYLLPPNELPPLLLLLREEPPPKELRAPLLPPPKERLPLLNERLLFNELPPRFPPKDPLLGVLERGVKPLLNERLLLKEPPPRTPLPKVPLFWRLLPKLRLLSGRFILSLFGRLLKEPPFISCRFAFPKE